MEKITSEGIVVTNRVFVGGIPSWMNEIKLQLEFEDLNMMVKATRIVEDMKTGKPKGYGFVTFFETRVAEELIREGCMRTKSGLKFRISTAIRKKALELRLQQKMTNVQRLPTSLIQPPNTPVQFLQLPSTPTQSQMVDFYHGTCYFINSYPGSQLYQPSNGSSMILYNSGY